jgi:hypothetical protein
MKTATKVSLTVLILLLATSALQASGLVGIYAIVSKVVLEPNDRAPERIQIWGAFTLVDGGTGRGGKTLTPQRGYMYFSLPGTGNFGTDNRGQKEAALKEWADFKAIAGTGQAVAFGRFGYIGAFADELISKPAENPPVVLMGGDPANFNGSHSKNPIRRETTTPASPDAYPMNMGLSKLSGTGNLAAVVNQLQQALKR